ncbi:MAG: YtxH domain-containing protein [Actinomycetota bacterium]
MRGRLGFLIGFGAGYVLGAKAGTERYEQLRRLYNNLLSSPAFQEASGKAKGAVGSGIGQAKDKAAERVAKVTEAVKDRRADDGSPGLSVAPPPSNG